MASIVSDTSPSSKRTIEKVDGTIENGTMKKSKSKPTKVTKKELQAMVKKFDAYYESMKHKTVEDDSCHDKKELERRCEAIRMLLTLWGEEFVDDRASEIALRKGLPLEDWLAIDSTTLIKDPDGFDRSDGYMMKRMSFRM